MFSSPITQVHLGCSIPSPAQRSSTSSRSPLPEPSDEELARLKELWENNAPRFEPNPGATDEELDNLEKVLGMPITGQLRALLNLVNGAELSWDEYDEDFEDSEEFDESDVTRGMDLLTAESIAKEHKNWLDLAASGSYDDVAFDMGEPCRTQPRLVHPGWIPFAGMDGNLLGVDTVPGPNGIVGQVIEYGTESTSGPYVVADSIADLLVGNMHEWVAPEDTVVDLAGERDLTSKDVPENVQELRIGRGKSARVADVLHATNVKLLSLGGLASVDLEGIERLPLQELRLSGCTVDLAPLANHPTLRRLELRDVTLTNATVLETLPALESIHLLGSATFDVEKFAPNPHLSTTEFRLSLGTDRAALEKLTGLYPGDNYRFAHYKGERSSLPDAPSSPFSRISRFFRRGR